VYGVTSSLVAAVCSVITFLAVVAIYVALGITTIAVLRAMSRRFRQNEEQGVPYGPRERIGSTAGQSP